MKSHLIVFGTGFLVGLFSNRLFWMMGRMVSLVVIGLLIIGVIALLTSGKKESN